MYIALVCLFLPTTNTFTSYPPEVNHLIYGDLAALDDLFLPGTADNVTESDMKTISKINIRDLFRDTDETTNDPANIYTFEDTQNITSDGEDAREYNEVTMRYNFTRRREWWWYMGMHDPDDSNWFHWGEIIEDKKIQMFANISLQYLYHTRYKIDLAFKQRESMRKDKRYKLGYLFNRLRRLRTEMLKFVAIAKEQYTYDNNKFENLTSLMRLYERVVRFDVDIRDTTSYIKRVFRERASFDKFDQSAAAPGQAPPAGAPAAGAPAPESHDGKPAMPKHLDMDDFGKRFEQLLVG